MKITRCRWRLVQLRAGWRALQLRRSGMFARDGHRECQGRAGRRSSVPTEHVEHLDDVVFPRDSRSRHSTDAGVIPRMPPPSIASDSEAIAPLIGRLSGLYRTLGLRTLDPAAGQHPDRPLPGRHGRDHRDQRVRVPVPPGTVVLVLGGDEVDTKPVVEYGAIPYRITHPGKRVRARAAGQTGERGDSSARGRPSYRRGASGAVPVEDSRSRPPS